MTMCGVTKKQQQKNNNPFFVYHLQKKIDIKIMSTGSYQNVYKKNPPCITSYSIDLQNYRIQYNKQNLNITEQMMKDFFLHRL